MDCFNFDALIYNIDKLENKDKIIKKEEEIENNHICNYIYDNEIGNYVCTLCGLVNTEMNKFKDGNENEIINNYHPIEIESTKIKGIRNYQLNQKAQRIYSSIDYEKKELLKVMNDITKHCNDLKIQKNISDDAQLIYKNVIKAILEDKSNKFIKVRGRNNEGLEGACIYYACLKNNLCITIQKISKSMNNLKQTYIHSECGMIQKLMKTHQELKQFINKTCFY